MTGSSDDFTELKVDVGVLKEKVAQLDKLTQIVQGLVNFQNRLLGYAAGISAILTIAGQYILDKKP